MKSTDVHPADLVPDFPSDWIPYDPDMTENPWDFDNYFNRKDYEDFYSERYSALIYDEQNTFVVDPVELEEQETLSTSEKSIDVAEDGSQKKILVSRDEGLESEKKQESEKSYQRTVLNNLYETIKLLKDAGNLALLEENLDLAAYRYDKAIRYGAIATMSFPSKHLRPTVVGGYHLEWDPLIRVLIATRLNLALLLMKPYFLQYEHALKQAQRALHDLGPFCVTVGMIMKGAKLDQVHRENEPEQTYQEAMALQAKAYFRLGSAQYGLHEYDDAILSYEKSVRCTELAGAKPDNLVIRRLTEAKRENKRNMKRRRKKFKFAFVTEKTEEPGGEVEDEE